MRNLQDWLGKTVVYSGYIELWNKETDYGYILLTNVTLRPYKASADENRRIDHLWFKLDGYIFDSVKQMGRLSNVAGVATCIEYTRSNSTTDYGILPLEGDSIAKFFRAIMYLRKILCKYTNNKYKKNAYGIVLGCNTLMLQVVDTALTLLTKEELLYGINYTYEEVYKYFETLKSECKEVLTVLYPKQDLATLVPPKIIKPVRKHANKVVELLSDSSISGVSISTRQGFSNLRM